MTRDEIEKLKALEREATPGPWVEDDGNIFSGPLSDKRHDAIMRGLDGEEVERPEHDGFVATTTQVQPNFIADAEFIPAARNALPRLLEERERLLEALRAARRLPMAQKHRTIIAAEIAFAEAPAK